MTTTPDTEQRRERYVDAILAALARDTSRGPNWHAADAAMAVADQEQQEMADGCARFTAAVRAENTRLRDEVATLDRACNSLDHENADLRSELKERKATLGALVQHWRGLALDRATTIERLRKEASEVRAAALTEAADFLRDAHFRDGMSVQEIGTALRHTAAAARPDDTKDA